MRQRLDRLVAGLARLLLRVFFRRIEVVGLGRIPRDRPLLLVGNHVNALIDPVAIVATLPLAAHFLAKSTLWANPLLRPVLALGRAIPVFRRQDAGEDTGKNLETFSRCHEILARRGAIALFPEGQSHHEASLTPLRTGAARILLEAEERCGPLGARIVPVGLLFEDKGRFRSRVLVVVGEALDPAPEVELAGQDPREAVRRLTERISGALAQVTLNYSSWDEARLLGRAADLFEHPEGGLPERRSLAAGFSLQQAFIRGYRDLLARDPKAVGGAVEKVAAYDGALAREGLDDRQVAAGYPLPPVLLFLFRTVVLLLLLLPLAALGMLLNWVPYRLAGVVARRIARRPDEVATWKLFPSLLLFPSFWGLAAAVAGGWTGEWAAGLATLLVAPLTGLVILRFHDRWETLRQEARAFLLLRFGRRRAAALKELRRHACEEVAALAGRHAAG